MDNLFERGNHPLLSPLRERAWQAFLTQYQRRQAPHLEDLPWRWMGSQSWQSPPHHATPDLPTQDSSLLFIDGRYAPAFSSPPPEMVVLPHSEAAKAYGPLLRRHLNAQLRKEKDPLALLNASLSEGLFLYLPPNITPKQPLHLIFLRHREGVLSTPRVDLFLGRGGSLSLKVVEGGKSPPIYWENGLLATTLEEGASLSISEKRGGSPLTALSIRARMKAHSSFRHFSFAHAHYHHHSDILMQMEGEGAEGRTEGLSLARNKGRATVHIRAEHLSPNATSHQHYKSLACEEGATPFYGDIYVAQVAQQTEAYQLNNQMLLGERAQGKSCPNLEIFADDVKASHGATFCRPEEEELFYLLSRGIAHAEARHLLIRGFCHHFLEQVPHIATERPTLIEALNALPR
ncbi:MAG: SufD family Fe-S cluster assembly protein [Chlamydiota bacterium]|nr:SufD family Fe-S cluster assembly protein [Chlamydiota bacterium]